MYLIEVQVQKRQKFTSHGCVNGLHLSLAQKEEASAIALSSDAPHVPAISPLFFPHLFWRGFSRVWRCRCQWRAAPALKWQGTGSPAGNDRKVKGFVLHLLLQYQPPRPY